MSQYSGYAESLSQGDQFSARTREHNDMVLAQNQLDLDAYSKEIKDQKGKVRTDEINEGIASTLFGGKSGEQLLSSGVGTLDVYQGIQKAGSLGGYLKGAKEGRLNTISSTVKRLSHGDPLPKPTPMIEDPGKSIINQWAGKPAVVEQVANDADKVAEVGGKIEGSGAVSTILKKGLQTAGLGEKIGEAGLSAISEVGSKVIGDFAGVSDIVEGFDNLGHGKNFFGNDDTAHKWGDGFQMAGATMDLMGTVFPPLEVLGGISSLVGGAIDGIDDIFEDHKKKAHDSSVVTKPTPQSTIVTPTYSSLGLVASAPISAKMSIVGSDSF
jgi:hypothetical protein